MSDKEKSYIEGIKTDRFHCSLDELEYRMHLKQKLQEEPIQKAVALLEVALEKVLTKLGVDCTEKDASIPDQQRDLGIIIQDWDDPRAPQLNGYFIHLTVPKKGREILDDMTEDDVELIPYGWVGNARINSLGECFVDIQYFLDDRLEESGGFKL